jgi:O-antigen/teichoic acid export membrane protein
MIASPMSTRAAVVETTLVGRRERRPALAGAWVVSAAMLASGMLIYAFHAGAARALGGSAYGRIAVLWAAMFLVVIVVFRPLEQATARALADRHARGEDGRTVVRSVVVLALCALAALAPISIAAWEPVTDGLFGGDDVMTAMLLVGIVCYGVAYVSRGVVTGARWFSGYGLGLMADAVSRLLIAAPLLFVASLPVAAAAVTVAGLVGALAPLAVGRGRLAPVFEGTPGESFRLGRTLRFAAPASTIAAADQLLVNCSPLLVMLEGGGAKAAGLVFAATMLVRVPTYVFQGLASSILPNLTRLHAGEHSHRFRRATLETAGFLLGAGVVIVAFAAAVGPEALRMIYGPGFDASRGALVLLGAGVAFYLSATTFSQALLALEASARASVAWIAAAVLFVGLYFALPGSELERVSLAFAVATLADLLILAALLHRRTRAG